VGDKGSRLSVDEDVLAGLSAPAYDPQASPRIRSKTSADVLPDFIGAGDGQRMQTEMKLTVPTSGVVPVSVPQARLKNRAQIQRMVVGVLQRQLPRLRSCYENRLRADPNIAGKWTLSLTVTSEGWVAGARAVGQGQRDELLEDCVVKKIESWRFQRIDGTLPIQKTVAFDRR